MAADFFPEDLPDDFEDLDFLPLDFLPLDFLAPDFLAPDFFDRPGRRSASDEATDAARSAASVAASRALVTSRSSRSTCAWSRATTSCATRSAVSRAACSAERSTLLVSAAAGAGVGVVAGAAAFDADFLALVALTGAFLAAVLFVGALVAVAFFAVAFFAGGRVVFFEVALSVSAMLSSIRASRPGRNRGVETSKSPTRFSLATVVLAAGVGAVLHLHAAQAPKRKQIDQIQKDLDYVAGAAEGHPLYTPEPWVTASSGIRKEVSPRAIGHASLTTGVRRRG